jgi:hypothetical protein
VASVTLLLFGKCAAGLYTYPIQTGYLVKSRLRIAASANVGGFDWDRH